MYLVCWSKDGREFWEVIDGEDSFQVFVSDLVSCGIEVDDIVYGKVIED